MSQIKVDGRMTHKNKIVLRHAMIDLETMSTHPDAAIVSMGVVPFDPRYGKIAKKKLYMEFDWENQNRKIDEKTLQWWENQSPEARAALNGLDTLESGLEALCDFLPPDVKVWGNGSLFDIGMLENAMRQYNVDFPWKFWNVLDCRTVLAMYEAKRGGLNKTANRQGLHNALEDAIFQARCINKMWKELLAE